MTGLPVRRPAVAGLFYPSRPDALKAELGRLVLEASPKRNARAVLVPHAGWMYSGRLAGTVYGAVTLPRLAVILGPNHTGLGPPGSLMARGRWVFPGGDLQVADSVACAILSASRVLEDDELAHRREHAIEVQLPFLRHLRPDSRFVPITLRGSDLDFCEDVGHAVATAVRRLAEPALLVCSSDLNHHESQAISNRKDRLAIDAVLSLDPERLLRTVREHRISMCGIAPAVATLVALRELHCESAELVRYETSGDISGDFTRVVGYAGIILE